MGQGLHFRDQNRHWSILTGALVAKHYIMLAATCKICAKMTHNVIVGYWHAGQNAPISILTSEKIPRAQLPINRQTTCKICAKMTHNVMVGCYRAGQNAAMSILTSEM